MTMFQEHFTRQLQLSRVKDIVSNLYNYMKTKLYMESFNKYVLKLCASNPYLLFPTGRLQIKDTFQHY